MKAAALSDVSSWLFKFHMLSYFHTLQLLGCKHSSMDRAIQQSSKYDESSPRQNLNAVSELSDNDLLHEVWTMWLYYNSSWAGLGLARTPSLDLMGDRILSLYVSMRFFGGATVLLADLTTLIPLRCTLVIRGSSAFVLEGWCHEWLRDAKFIRQHTR